MGGSAAQPTGSAALSGESFAQAGGSAAQAGGGATLSGGSAAQLDGSAALKGISYVNTHKSFGQHLASIALIHKCFAKDPTLYFIGV